MVRTALIGILLSSAMYGCSAQNESQGLPVAEIVKNQEMEQKMEISSVKGYGTDYQAYWGTKVQSITKAGNGYYYFTMLEPLYLMYFDGETKSSIPVCAKAECNHDNAECNAFFGNIKTYDHHADEQEYYSGMQLYYYNDLLYVLSTEGYLVAITPDGSERRKIAKVCIYDGSSDTKFTFYDNYVYVYNSAGNSGSNQEHTETIKRYSLGNGKEETVVAYTASSAAINSVKNYGDRMYFLISSITVNKTGTASEIQYTYNGLYVYDHKTGKAGKIIDAQVTSYAIDEENETIYYFVFGDGLYQYDVLTKKTEKLLDATEEIGIAEMSYDGKYLYLYNGEWTSYVKRNTESKVDTHCWVLDSSGNVVRIIDFNEPTICYFGDEKYLFADQKISSGLETKSDTLTLTVMDKSNITSSEWKAIMQKSE